MINRNKCQHCEAQITKVEVEDVRICIAGRETWKGYSYACPSCRSILSVEMNPQSLKIDLLNELVKLLKR